MIGEIAALGAAVSWTVSAVLYRKALQQTKPVSANILRLSCTSAILMMFLIGFGKFDVLTGLPTNVIALAVISGVVGLGLGDTLYLASLKSIGVARAVPLSCTYPLFNLVWATFLIREPVTLSVVFGALLILFGIWLLSHESERSTVELHGKTLVKGVTAALAAAMLWSVSITMMNLAVQEAAMLEQAFAINTIRVAGVSILLLVFSPVFDRNLSFLKVSRKTFGALIVGGIVALGMGWFFLTYSFVETLESRAVPISSTTPLFSMLVAVVLFHERITWKHALGSILIVAGIFSIFLIK